MFPNIERPTASIQGILKKMMATGIDPRSSISGSIEIISTISLGLSPLELSQLTAVSENEDANNPDTVNISTEVISSVLRFKLFKRFSKTYNMG